MAATRKLQTEIDRTLKKVDEGVELFDEIWEKVYSARDPNHKEKYEQDLKKEIKKLQRHRDQIKTWLGANDIKDKKNLTEARKLIESKMEQFKICEKEAKTKMFSKEGLAREQKVDPKEAAKNRTREWLANAVSNLNTQSESFDADLERLSAGKGKSKNKDDIAALEESLAGHKRHVAKLEQIIRLMDNDLIDVEGIDELKEDIEYFVESNQEPDYQSSYDDDMEMYETLDLDEAPIQMVDLLNQERGPKKSPREGEEDGDGDGEGGMGGGDDDDMDKSTSSSKTATSTSASGGKKDKGGAGGSGGEVLKGIGRPAPAGKGQSSPSPVSTRDRAGLSSTITTVRPGITTTTTTKAPPPSPGTPGMAGRPTASAIVAGTAGTTKPTAAQALLKGGGLGMSGSGGGAGDGTGATAGTPGGTTAADVVREKPTQAAILAQAQAGQQQRAVAQRQAQQQQALASQQQMVAQQQAQQQQSLAAQQATLLDRQKTLQQAGGQPPSSPGGPGALQPPSSSTTTTTTTTTGTGSSAPGAASPALAGQPTPPSGPSPSPSPLQQPQPPSSSSSVQPPATPPLASIVAHQGPVGSEQQQGHPPTHTLTQQQQQAQQQQQQAGGFATTLDGSGTGGVGGQGGADTQGTHIQSLDAATAAAFGTGAGGVNVGVSPNNKPATISPETLQLQMNYLNRAMLYIPTQHDAERPKQYFPRNPYPVNAAFPLAPAPIFESPAIFEKLGPDTLFFIFYYQQGTYQQYLAAKELKKQSWRYHKKYMTWFQRHEEPKVTTEEFEQGTYVYFDCESGWCTRIKQEFCFEYAFLENEEV